MGFGAKVRNCDKFGAPISLTFEADSDYKTMCGGVASLCLHILILGYFCK